MRILVTGSAQGVGAQTARDLVALGHEVVVHGRDRARAAVALAGCPGAVGSIAGALDSLAQTRALAESANQLGPYDAVIHNAGLGPHRPQAEFTEDGLEAIFQVNVVAPYVLTCLMPVPSRLVYVGSDASDQGTARLDDLWWRDNAWDPWHAYNDSKLFLAMVMLEVAARHPEAAVNFVHPGWVKTEMGGPGAQLELSEGADSSVWLATSDDSLATGRGAFIDKRELRALNPLALDASRRAELMARLEDITGLALR
jgi:NAD(P)-dependent dehydrogenase (short-subunit alcohol dehydrogenase family)